MGKEEESRGKQILETFYIPVPNNVKCVACLDTIPKGEDAFESPSTAGKFYHPDCFKEMVRQAGKDPGTFIKMIPINTPDTRKIH